MMSKPMEKSVTIYPKVSHESSSALIFSLADPYGPITGVMGVQFAGVAKPESCAPLLQPRNLRFCQAFQIVLVYIKVSEPLAFRQDSKLQEAETVLSKGLVSYGAV